MNKEDLLKHLSVQTYDKNYQDIVPLGFKGYSRSYQTWERIRGLVDWNGLSVVDLGCFHGYFSFRVKEAGADRVDGLDYWAPALVTARKISQLEGLEVTFSEWDDSKEIPDCDVTLLLNALHHFKDPLGCLNRIRSERVIMEIKAAQKPLVESVFDVTSTLASARRGRVILLAKKKA